MWGGSSEGQLGLGDTENQTTPTLLKTEHKVISVACGYYHTAIVTGKYYHTTIVTGRYYHTTIGTG